MKTATRATETVAAGAASPADGSFVPASRQPPRWTTSGGADQLPFCSWT